MMTWFFKYLLSKIIKNALLPLYLFPLNKKRILFISYGGRQYSCNPKYVSEYLIENYKDKLEIVWVFRQPEKFTTLDDSVIKVRYLSLSHFYYVITSAVCITNMGFNKFFYVRNGQRFVQTWHGGGAYKRSGKSIVNNIFQRKLDEEHDSMVSDFISSSDYFTKYFIRDLSYHNNILNSGMPRNAFLLKNADNNELKKNIKRKIDHDCNKDNFYILYAPTWRDDSSHYELPDFEKIMSIVQEKYNQPVVVLFRSHHFHNIDVSSIKEQCVDVTSYPDMQELLLISDLLISDYSSSIWDFSLLYKPCLLYVPDLPKYESARGLYTSIYDWGFTVCMDNVKLEDAIERLDPIVYIENIKKMHAQFGSYENVNASQKLLNVIGLIEC